MNILSPFRPHPKIRTVRLLRLGALGAVLFVCAAALIFYRIASSGRIVGDSSVTTWLTCRLPVATMVTEEWAKSGR